MQEDKSVMKGLIAAKIKEASGFSARPSNGSVSVATP